MSTMDSSRHLASLKEVSVWPSSSGWWKASNPVTSEYGVVTVLLSLAEIFFKLLKFSFNMFPRT